MASAKWEILISEELSKSAIVLATFKILQYALALKPNLSKALSNTFLQSLVSLQYLFIRDGDSSAFEKIL